MTMDYLNGRVVVHGGDCLEVLRTLADNSIDSVVTDPPYALVSVAQRFANSPQREHREHRQPFWPHWPWFYGNEMGHRRDSLRRRVLG